MKITKLLFLFFFISAISFAQKSPKKQAEGQIQGVSIVIDYGSPSVKERVIWGKLVKYNKVWRAGANENTTFSFDKDVTIAGNTLPAGKYGFFIIPSEKGDWTIIFNNKNDAWGHFSYKQKNDILRVPISPKHTNTNQEQLTYSVHENSINFAWEKVEISIPITIK